MGAGIPRPHDLSFAGFIGGGEDHQPEVIRHFGQGPRSRKYRGKGWKKAG